MTTAHSDNGHLVTASTGSSLPGLANGCSSEPREVCPQYAAGTGSSPIRSGDQPRRSLLLCTSQLIVGEALRDLIAAHTDAYKVTEMAITPEAVRLAVTDEVPQVVVVDFNLPYSSLRLVQALKDQSPNSVLIILASSVDARIVRFAVAAGADAVLVSGCNITMLLAAIELALGGHTIVPSSSVAEAFDIGPDSTLEPSGAPELSSDETALLRLIVDGKTNRAIARILNFSERTIRRRVDLLYQRLGVTGRFEVIALAMRRRLLT